MEINITELLTLLKNKPIAKVINSESGQSIRDEMIKTVNELYWSDAKEAEILLSFINGFFDQYKKWYGEACSNCETGSLHLSKANEPYSPEHLICDKCDSTYCL